MFVALLVLGGELFLEAQEVVGGIPLVDGGVVVDLVGIAEERGAEVSGALAKELRPGAYLHRERSGGPRDDPGHELAPLGAPGRLRRLEEGHDRAVPGVHEGTLRGDLQRARRLDPHHSGAADREGVAAI